MEQVRGIEPPYQPWEGRVLPLNYTCKRWYSKWYSITKAGFKRAVFDKMRILQLIPWSKSG